MSRAPANGVLRIGTRGSALAQAQTALVVQTLREWYPDLRIETIVIRTSGDRQQREVVGAFVKELQDALLHNRIDVAVHSLKDLPTQGVEGLTVAAIPPRADARDVLISKGESFFALREGSRVGAGSLRRCAQLRWRRCDLQYLPLVGNVDTRIRKLHEGQYDAIVLAAAGLQRLGFLETADDRLIPMPDGTELHLEIFDKETLLPAPGQGALALECREEDTVVLTLLRKLDHLPSRQAVTAERALLYALGGGCRVPIGAYAEVQGEQLVLNALVATPDGHELIRDVITGSAAEAGTLGAALAEQMLARGASKLLGN